MRIFRGKQGKQRKTGNRDRESNEKQGEKGRNTVIMVQQDSKRGNKTKQEKQEIEAGKGKQVGNREKKGETVGSWGN